METVSSLTLSLLISPLASLLPEVSSQLASLKSLGQDRLPKVVSTRLSSTRDQVRFQLSFSFVTPNIWLQVAACVYSLDATLCSGLDQLVDKVLYASTPAHYTVHLYTCTRFTRQQYTYILYSVLQVPALKTPTPALYNSTRKAAVSQLTQATTYLASFTLAQLALKVTFHTMV